MDSDPFIAERFQIIEVALLFSSLAFFLAWMKGLFSWPSRFSKNEITTLSPWTIAGAFFVYFFSEFFIGPAVAGLWILWNHGSISSDADLNQLTFPLKESFNLIAIVTAACVLFLYCFFLGSKVRGWIWNRGEYHSKNRLKNFLGGAGTWILSYPLVLIISQGVSILVYYLYQEPIPPLEQTAVKYLRGLMDYPTLFWVTAFAIILIVPIAEELLFRGFLQTWLEQHVGRVKAIFWVSLIFSSMHFSSDQGMGNWELLSALFVLSCFLGFIYEKQRSLWAPIGLHIAFNGISVMMILWQE